MGEGEWGWGRGGGPVCAGWLGVESVHVSPSASMQKKEECLNESGAGFILHGRFGSRTGDSNQLGRSQRMRMRNVFEDTV